MFFIDATVARIGTLGYSAITWVSIALTFIVAIMNLLDMIDFLLFFMSQRVNYIYRKGQWRRICTII